MVVFQLQHAVVPAVTNPQGTIGSHGHAMWPVEPGHGLGFATEYGGYRPGLRVV